MKQGELSGMVDTHAHLNHPDFERDWQDVLARARACGVEWVVNVGYDLTSSRTALTQSGQADNLFSAIGIHPHHAAEHDDATLSDLRELCRTHPKVIAIGETGLDFHRNLSPPVEQERAFEALLSLAQEHALPVILHVRAAHERAQAVVRRCAVGEPFGVVHCFDGDVPDAKGWLELGFYIGITGLVTFKPRDDVRRVSAYVPDDRLLIETDSPYLAPVPYRGKRNEPAYVRHVLEAIAKVRRSDFETLRQRTTENANRLFFGRTELLKPRV